jgi:hypothetical protein
MVNNYEGYEMINNRIMQGHIAAIGPANGVKVRDSGNAFLEHTHIYTSADALRRDTSLALELLTRCYRLQSRTS